MLMLICKPGLVAWIGVRIILCWSWGTMQVDSFVILFRWERSFRIVLNQMMEPMLEDFSIVRRRWWWRASHFNRDVSKADALELKRRVLRSSMIPSSDGQVVLSGR
jgi:hypothetical protein